MQRNEVATPDSFLFFFVVFFILFEETFVEVPRDSILDLVDLG